MEYKIITKIGTIIYDRADRESIERHAKLLVGKSTREIFAPDILVPYENIDTSKAKGTPGQLIEEHYFGKKPNNDQAPDFREAKVELKVTPIKELVRGGYSAKERLVLNIIDYNKMAKEVFENSTFFNKNAALLLIFYIHSDEKNFLDFIFKLAKLWKIEKEDLRIIKGDWLKIQKKIEEGRAHEISEGDTLYLGACTKGANSKTLREQPNSEIQAKQRALSLKQGFMTRLFNRLYEIEKKRIRPKDEERVVKSLGEYEEGKTFEDIVIERFDRFIGKTTDEIQKILNVKLNKKSKNYYADLARRMMGVMSRKIEEFEKAEVVMKTIRFKQNGIPKEDMSFPAFKYTEIVNEDWEESTLREQFEKRFFFVAYQYNEKNELRLKKVMFWTMPIKDLDKEGFKVWQRTRELINTGVYDSFPKKSENVVTHIRPHAMNNQDKFLTPQGGSEVKRCFWINAQYVAGQL